MATQDSEAGFTTFGLIDVRKVLQEKPTGDDVVDSGSVNVLVRQAL